MKRSTKAALLSGLVFPGIGHLYLKSYLRTAILAIGALIASSVIFRIAAGQAQRVVDRIYSGDVPLDATSLEQLLSSSSNASDDLAANVALAAFGVCWLAGIVDSWRLGARSEDQPEE